MPDPDPFEFDDRTKRMLEELRGKIKPGDKERIIRRAIEVLARSINKGKRHA